MTKPTHKQPDPLLNQALVALKRAGLQARKTAAQTGTALVVCERAQVQRITFAQLAGDVSEAHSEYPTKDDK